MDTPDPGSDIVDLPAVDGDADADLTLHDAALRYDVTARTLAQHIRCGQLPAYKTRGTTGREWRVTPAALRAAGYRLRPAAPQDPAADDPLVAELRRELALARRTAAAERRRADDLDRRLGHAQLECGHLRTALAAATGQEQDPADADLDTPTARWLLDTVTRARSDQARSHAGRS